MRQRRLSPVSDRRPLYVFPEVLPLVAALAVLVRWSRRRHPDAKRQRARKVRDVALRRAREMKQKAASRANG